MFKLPNLPSPKADIHELADFAELLAWQFGHVSSRDIVAYLGRIDDNDKNIGCEDNEDENTQTLDEVMNEIERRSMACGQEYPFKLERKGTVLRYDVSLEKSQRSLIYRYLLLSTRLNMKNNRVHDSIDGTILLEPLSAHVLRNYLGKEKAKSFVFGTSCDGSFQDRVEYLCQAICEGSGFRNIDEASAQAKDDKLDAVAWVPFSDCLPGQLIVFCQCKTGSNWSEAITELHPEAFIKRWMRDPVIVNPARALCVSEAADRSKWRGHSVYSGILFDRCRMVDFCDDIDGEIEEKIKRWTMAAKSSLNTLFAS
jgi:hypothetical protein